MTSTDAEDRNKKVDELMLVLSRYVRHQRGRSEVVDYVKKFELVMTTLLLAMMAVIVVLSITDLAWLLIKDILSPPLILLDVDELLDIFGAFLLVLIGIELLETLKAYQHEREIRTEDILLVAMIALARKIIILDLKAVPSISLLGIAAIIVSLGITYYIIRQTRNRTANRRAPRKTK